MYRNRNYRIKLKSSKNPAILLFCGERIKGSVFSPSVILEAVERLLYVPVFEDGKAPVVLMDFPAAVIAHTVAAIRYGFAAFDAFFPLNRSDSYRTAGADVLLFSDSLIADRATPWEKRSD